MPVRDRDGAMLAVLVWVLLGVWSCDSPAAGVVPAPVAEIVKPGTPGGPSTVRLTLEAIEKLGIEVVPMEQRIAPKTRTLGGVIVTSPGGSITVAAPQAGTVLAPWKRALPLPGQQVARGRPLLRMVALSPGELARAREVMEVAEARVAVAEERVRAGRGATSEIEEAGAALRAARARLQLLAGGGGSTREGLVPFEVLAPSDGVVRELRVSAGQSVPSGAILLELIRTDPVWVRVPVYVGDLAQVRAEEGAEIRLLGATSATSRRAEPVTGPPSADPLAASVDLFFSLANPDGALRPGQVVEAILTLSESGEARLVPQSAVIYDAYGNTWIYTQEAPRSYSRRRIEISHVVDGNAVLARGPATGTPVVTIGAAELYGTEFEAGSGSH